MLQLIKSVLRSIAKAVAEDPEVKKLVERHPCFFHFIRRRTDPDAAFGLNLTLGVIIAGFFLFLFFGIVQDLIGHEAIVRADIRIVALLQLFRTPSFNRAMLFITYLGKSEVIFLGVVLASAILALMKKWYHVIALVVSVVVGDGLVSILKAIFHRSRPPLVNTLSPEHSFSFPSAHSFIAIAFYGLLAYFIFRAVKSRFAKIMTVAVALAIILAIGFSRIYLGVHYPSDVLGGYAAGAFWVSAVITSLEVRLKSRPFKNQEPYVSKQMIVIAGAVAFILWIGYVFYYFETHPLKPPSRVVEKPTLVSRNDIPVKLFIKYPRYSEDITGDRMEPINIIIIGSEPALNKAFRDAGWVPTDKISIASLYKIAKATITKTPYPKAPGTPSFWNARPNDFAFEKPTKANRVNEREHIHFWRTPFVLVNKAGDKIWFATVHFDKRIVIQNSILPTHEIDPFVDKEREKLKDELERTGDTSFIGEFQMVPPTLGQNQAGSKFVTDGKAYFIFLK